jgi:hypothetical protein
LLTDLGAFELGTGGAELLARHTWADVETITERTGFSFVVADALPVIDPPESRYVEAIRAIDGDRLCERLLCPG